jgi:hypothetical protein
MIKSYFVIWIELVLSYKAAIGSDEVLCVPYKCKWSHQNLEAQVWKFRDHVPNVDLDPVSIAVAQEEMVYE